MPVCDNLQRFYTPLEEYAAARKGFTEDWKSSDLQIMQKYNS